MKIEKLYLSIGGFIIEFCFIKDEEFLRFEDYFIALIKDYFKSFLIQYKNRNKIDFTIEVVYGRSFQTIVDKSKERVFINFYDRIGTRKIRTFYHVSGIQFQSIIRKVTYDLLSHNDGFIVHASAVKKDNKAYIFLGDSGAGKSTIMTMLSPQFTPMGDDTVIIRPHNKTFFCYSTSALEKNTWFVKNPERAVLNRVFFLRKSKKNEIETIKNEEKILALFGKQVYAESSNIKSKFPSVNKSIHTFKEFYILDFSLDNIKELRSCITGE